MGKIEESMNTGVGSGYYNRGDMIGALGGGVAGVRNYRAKKRSWDVTADQFSQLGPDGQKISALIRENPKMAEMHAERMGGWAKLYTVTKAGFARANLATATTAASPGGFTPQETQDLMTQGIRDNIPPSVAGAVPHEARSRFNQIMSQVTSNTHQLPSIIEAGQIFDQTGDERKAIAALKRLPGSPFPSNASELIKSQLWRAQLVAEGKQGTPEFREINRRIKVINKQVSDEGEMTPTRRDQKAKILNGRKQLRELIKKHKDAGDPLTIQRAFGVDPAISGAWNAEDPILDEMVKRAINLYPGETDAQHQMFWDWLMKNLEGDLAFDFEDIENPSVIPPPVVAPDQSSKDVENREKLEALLGRSRPQ